LGTRVAGPTDATKLGTISKKGKQVEGAVGKKRARKPSLTADEQTDLEQQMVGKLYTAWLSLANNAERKTLLFGEFVGWAITVNPKVLTAFRGRQLRVCNPRFKLVIECSLVESITEFWADIVHCSTVHMIMSHTTVYEFASYNRTKSCTYTFTHWLNSTCKITLVLVRTRCGEC